MKTSASSEKISSERQVNTTANMTLEDVISQHIKTDPLIMVDILVSSSLRIYQTLTSYQKKYDMDYEKSNPKALLNLYRHLCAQHNPPNTYNEQYRLTAKLNRYVSEFYNLFVAFDEIHLDTEKLSPEDDDRLEKADLCLEMLIRNSPNESHFMCKTTAYFYAPIHLKLMDEMGVFTERNKQISFENIELSNIKSSPRKRKISFFSPKEMESDLLNAPISLENDHTNLVKLTGR